jgi:hypothetical protein
MTWFPPFERGISECAECAETPSAPSEHRLFTSQPAQPVGSPAPFANPNLAVSRTQALLVHASRPLTATAMASTSCMGLAVFTKCGTIPLDKAGWPGDLPYPPGGRTWLRGPHDRPAPALLFLAHCQKFLHANPSVWLPIPPIGRQCYAVCSCTFPNSSENDLLVGQIGAHFP